MAEKNILKNKKKNIYIIENNHSENKLLSELIKESLSKKAKPIDFRLYK